MATTTRGSTSPGVRPAGQDLWFPSSGSVASGSTGSGTTAGELASEASQLNSGYFQYPMYDPEKMLYYTRQWIQEQQERFPGLVSQASDLSLTQSQIYDSYMRERYYRDLNKVLPDWRESAIGAQRDALEAVRSQAEQLSTGQLSDETRDYLRSAMSEINMSAGRFGGAARAAEALQIGQTMEQRKLQGAQLWAEGVSPLSSRLTSTALSLMPPTTDPTALYGQHLSGLMGVATASPTAVMQASAQIGLQNAAGAWQARESAWNAAMNVWSTNQQIALNQQALQVSQQNALMGGLFTVGGAALGGLAGNPALGAMIGSQAGSS